MKLSAGDWKFTYQPGCSRASANASASSPASASSASKSSVVQMSGCCGVVPAARYLLTVRTISRYRAAGTTPQQPDIWTPLDFEADEADAGELALAFADALEQPGWYVNFQSPAESFIVFPGRIFRYRRGD